MATMAVNKGKKAAFTHALEVAPLLEDPPDAYSGFVAADLLLPNDILVFKSYRLTREGSDYHGRYVLALCLRPAATVVVDGQLFDLEPGDGMLIFPHQYHRYTNVRNEDILWLFVTFNMPEPGVLEWLRYNPVRIPPDTWRCIDALLDFYRTDKKRTALGRNELAYRTAMLLNELVRTRDEIILELKDENDPNREVLRKIGRYVHAALDRPIPVSEIARYLSISESHLRRIFRNAVGIGLGKYIRQSRIHRATGLMDHTDLNFSQIAERCGFDSLYAFSRSFKTEMGVSPTEHRRYLRERKKNPLHDADPSRSTPPARKRAG